MATDLSATGYVPYYGPDVAAFSPLQDASFQRTDMMARLLECQRAEVNHICQKQKQWVA